MLAHIREKMHHTDEVIDFTECDLGDAEIELIRARGDLGEVKVSKSISLNIIFHNVTSIEYVVLSRYTINNII